MQDAEVEKVRPSSSISLVDLVRIEWVGFSRVINNGQRRAACAQQRAKRGANPREAADSRAGLENRKTGKVKTHCHQQALSTLHSLRASTTFVPVATQETEANRETSFQRGELQKNPSFRPVAFSPTPCRILTTSCASNQREALWRVAHLWRHQRVLRRRGCNGWQRHLL
jgi:hypothetical protein